MTPIADSIIAALAPREERITFEGHNLIVREVETAADTAVFQAEGDFLFKFVVASVLDEHGERVFTADHIPALRKLAKTRFLPLIKVVTRVNGLDGDEAEKNSGASPSA